jgi:MerR family mercuric resistance operon transcriptional regulator
MLTIGAVARQAGVGVETVRFYERQGLLAAPPRRPPSSPHQAGYRQYPEEAVARIRFIQRAKALGFSLREIAELLSLRSDGSCAEVRRRAADKLADIEGRIQALTRMKAVLARLIEGCPERAPARQCPILEALDHDHDHDEVAPCPQSS